MIARSFRLKKKKDFNQVMKTGRAQTSACLVLKYGLNQKEQARVGFVCSKNISKKAVVRNRIKRQMREATKDSLPKLRPGYDLIFLARMNIIDQDFWTIKRELEALLNKAGLLIKN